MNANKSTVYSTFTNWYDFKITIIYCYIQVFGREAPSSGRYKTLFKRVESKTSEIFVKESPAEPGDEVHSEGGEQHHEVRGRVPGADVGHSQDHQSPQTQRDKAGGETEAFELL